MNNKIPEIRFSVFADEWEEKKLDNISNIITKGTTPKDKTWTGSVNYVKTESIDRDSGNISVTANTTIEEHEGYLKRSRLKEGDVLFSIVGTIGRTGLVKISDLPANTNQQIAIIRLKNGINNQFIFQFLKTTSVLNFIKSDATIGAQPSLSLQQINNLNILIPSIQEQQKIGDFFKNLDHLIDLQQKKIARLKELKKGYLQKIFPNKDSKVPELRFDGFTDEWEKIKLKKLGAVYSGVGFPNSEQGLKKGTPFYKVSDMNNIDNKITMNSANNYVTDLQIETNNWQIRTPNNGGMLFAKVGAAIFLERKRLVNQPFLFDNNLMTFLFNNSLYLFFGKLLFENIQFTKYIQVGALPSIKGSDIQNIYISLPTIKEQKKIGNLFFKLDKLIDNQDKKIAQLKELKKGMLQKMFC